MINIMKLVKLVYLLDRLGVRKRNAPVVGGHYYSLPNGPITMELLDLLNAGSLYGAEESEWQTLISDRQDHEVSLQKEAPEEHLSEKELALIEEVYGDFGGMDQWQLREWTHKHCPEWTPLEHGRAEIDLLLLGRALGKETSEIEEMLESAREQEFVGTLLRKH